MMARLGMIVYRGGLVIAFMCEIAAVTILAAIATNKIIPDTDNWMAVWFFAVTGGVSWLVARAAKNALAG
jgi:uncharacterized integral membrane protein